MAILTWDGIGERVYETGVDRGEHGRFRRGQLGDRSLGAEASAMLLGLAFGPGRAQGQQQGRVEADLHVGDLRLDHLERTDRLAEALAFAHVGDRGLIGGTRQLSI